MEAAVALTFEEMRTPHEVDEKIANKNSEMRANESK